MRPSAVFLVAFALIFCFLPLQSADATPWFDGFWDGNSFTVGTGNVPAYNWDYLRVDIISGNRYFEAPVFTNVTDGWTNGWAGVDGSGNVITGTVGGSDKTTTVNFNLNFMGASLGSSVDFWWTVYDRTPSSSLWRETTLVHIRDGNLSWEAKGKSDFDPGVPVSDVPEPSTVAYLGILALGIGAAALRRRVR